MKNLWMQRLLNSYIRKIQHISEVRFYRIQSTLERSEPVVWSGVDNCMLSLNWLYF